MNAIRNYIPLIFSTLLLVALLAGVYPYYQYYIDPDAVGYLTVAKRYASGDYERAINGYWSPWSCWLTALFIKQNIEPFKSAIIVNAAGAICFLLASYFLFVKFITNRFALVALSSTLSVFLVFAVFKQSFADLWAFAFLLMSVRLMLTRKFLDKPILWIIVGLLGTLAYFAKAYALPYFVLNTLVCVVVLLKQENESVDYTKYVKTTIVIIFTLMLCSSPWIWMLHEKYGKWMTSTSGTLNLSWYLIGHPYYKEEINLLIPPVYNDAIYFWEDPYLMNGATPHFWNSPKLFLLQIVRIGYTILKMFNSMNELCCFFLPLTILFALIIFYKKVSCYFPKELLLTAVSFLLFPLGYLLINFESRYLWYLVPMSLLLGVLLWQRLESVLPNKYVRYVLLLVFCISYLAFPIWDMKSLYKVGEAEYKLAQQLNAANIKGSFASNIAQSKRMQEVTRVAYFSQNQFYYMPLPPKTNSELLSELERYNVNYYFHFQQPFEAAHHHFADASGNPYPVVFEDSVLIGLKVYQLRK